MRSFNRFLSRVRICSKSTTESFASPQLPPFTSMCVGSFVLSRLLVIAAAITVGLCLFLCCDLCVAAYQFPQILPQAVFEFVRVGMWLFYLPGQVLIALSGLPKSKFWRDEYENQ